MKEKQSLEFSYDYERVQGIVDPYDYMNQLGSAIGAIPSFFMNFELWKIVYLGSWSPYYYMLNHPDKHKREIAKKRIDEIKKTRIFSSNYASKYKIGYKNIDVFSCFISYFISSLFIMGFSLF